MNDLTPVSWKKRVLWMLLAYLVFSLLYSASNQYAASLVELPDIALPWEYSMPFVPCFIVPYLSSGLCFGLLLLLIAQREEWELMRKRIFIATLGAALLHFLVPLQFAWPRPAIENAFLAECFALLESMDKPFNQLPSLHLCFCLLYWQACSVIFAKLFWRICGYVWVAAIMLSTLFTYQHHVLDLWAALVMMCLLFVFVRRGRNALIGNLYMLGALLFCLPVLLNPAWAWLLWPAGAVCLVGISYFRGQVLPIKNKAGGYHFLLAVFLAPYLATYYLQRFVLRNKKNALVIELNPRLFYGAMLTREEAALHFKGRELIVYDLSAELPENATFRALGGNYKQRALLDLSAYELQAIVAEALADYRETQAVLYIHCTLGYSRSRCVAEKVFNHIPL